MKGPYSFPSGNKGGWKDCGVWDLLLLLGRSKGDEGKDLWGEAALGHSSRGCLRDSVALQMDFSVPVPAPAVANAKNYKGKICSEAAPVSADKGLKSQAPFLLRADSSCTQPHPRAARIIPEREPKTFGSITTPFKLNEQLSS